MTHVLLACAGPQRLLIQRPCAAFSQPPTTSYPSFSLHTNHVPPFLTVNLCNPSYARTRTLLCRAKASRSQKLNTQNLEREIEEEKQEYEEEDEDEEEFEDEFSGRGGYRGREEEKDYDRDPEFAEILGSCLDDPQKARSKVSTALLEFLTIFFCWVVVFTAKF